MIDAHIHIERGPYTLEWVKRFIAQAHITGITELYLLEHSHIFIDFYEYYSNVINYNEYQKEWIKRHSYIDLQDYIEFMNMIKNVNIPNIKLKFGLEVCYLPGIEKKIEQLKNNNTFDFYTGSIHWIEGWGFDHKKEFWIDKNIDDEYRKYFREEIKLIRTGIFDHLAHPDSIKCFNHYPTYNLDETYDEIVKAAKTTGIIFEQSCGLYNSYEHSKIGLENSYLVKLKKNNIPLVPASDAHRPEDVGKNIKKAMDIVNII